VNRIVGTGGQIPIDALRNNGADVILGVPGESCLAALDTLDPDDWPDQTRPAAYGGSV